jgi:hypothetical protein
MLRYSIQKIERLATTYRLRVMIPRKSRTVFESDLHVKMAFQPVSS